MLKLNYFVKPALAFWGSVLLEVTVCALVILIGTRSIKVALFLVPYRVWGLFALLLNAQMVRLNNSRVL